MTRIRKVLDVAEGKEDACNRMMRLGRTYDQFQHPNSKLAYFQVQMESRWYTFSDSFVSLSRTSVISLSNFSRSSEAAIVADIKGSYTLPEDVVVLEVVCRCC